MVVVDSLFTVAPIVRALYVTLVLLFSTLCPPCVVNHIDGEERERASCFILFVFLMACDC